MILTKYGMRLCVIAALIGLNGCATNTPYEAIFDQNQTTLQQQYGRDQQPAGYVGYANGEDLESYSRDALNELDNLFPELPNPRLTIYVFPHLNDSGAPIPGYSTAFYLYDHRRVFALPGETQ